jgi:uncharacterized protein (DUF58 family)
MPGIYVFGYIISLKYLIFKPPKSSKGYINSEDKGSNAVTGKPSGSQIGGPKLRLNTWLLPFLAVIFAALYVFSGFRGWLIFFVGMAAAWLLALLWVVALRRNLRVERHLHLAWATVGESVQEELILINRSWLPAVWVEINDTNPGLSMPVQLVSDIGSKSSRRRYLSHQCGQRGLYKLGPTRLRTSDPFGIYTLTIFDEHSDTILVTPPLLPMNKIRVAPAGWGGDRQHRRRAMEREISDAGVREYQPGDSLRRIHWPASAHSDQLIVRQLEASASGDWWIFVDLEAQVQAGAGRDSTVELSIVLAASLAMHRLKENHRVGLAFAGPELVWLEPRADLAHRWRILKALAMAGVGQTSLVDLIRMRHPAQRATLIAVTPTTEASWMGAALRQGRAGQYAVLVDPAEFGGSSDQSQLVSALASSAIPFKRAPRTLLEEAYPSTSGSLRGAVDDSQMKRHYLRHGRSAWQQMG